MEICEAVGTVLASDVPTNADLECDEGYYLNDELVCTPIEVEEEIPKTPKKLVKLQIDEILKKKRAELKELLKQKFGDKWKEKWKNARSELLNNLDLLLEWIQSLKRN